MRWRKQQEKKGGSLCFDCHSTFHQIYDTFMIRLVRQFTLDEIEVALNAVSINCLGETEKVSSFHTHTHTHTPGQKCE